MLNQIYESCKYVSDHSKSVKINYDVVDQFILDLENPSFWLSNNPFQILDLNYKSIIHFLLIYHTIGDYCFWGNPKWKITTESGKLDGSFATIYIILNRYKDNPNFNLTFEEFKELMKGNIEIPLLQERYNSLVVMNEFLGESNFYDKIKDMYVDCELFTYIIENLPYFEDVRMYNGKKIYFYKRAQLLVSDILHVRKLIEKVCVDYSHLVGCADYKLPQVLNSFRALEYTIELNNRIENCEEIEINDECEVEIRANTLMVIDYIYRKLDSKVDKMDINDYIWSLGQDKSKIDKQYHRTKTTNY